jgi:hypothetical protein
MWRSALHRYPPKTLKPARVAFLKVQPAKLPLSLLIPQPPVLCEAVPALVPAHD